MTAMGRERMVRYRVNGDGKQTLFNIAIFFQQFKLRRLEITIGAVAINWDATNGRSGESKLNAGLRREMHNFDMATVHSPLR